MITFLACSTSGDGRCLGGRLRVVRVDGAAKRGSRSLEDRIRLHVEEALKARDARRATNASSGLTFLLKKTPAAGRGPIPQSDLKGIVGEIVAEAVLVECGFGEPFYSKWRHAGTSASRGIDIVLRKGNSISVNEAKHLHSLRPGKSPLPDIARAITSAFRQNTDRRTRYRLVLLWRQCASAERLGNAMHGAPPGAGAPPWMSSTIKNAVSAWSISVNVVVVLDARHDADADAIRRRLGQDTARGTVGPAAAVVSHIDGLHEATVQLIRSYC